MAKSKYLSRELLEELLFVRRLSVQQMAKECKVSVSTIQRRLRDEKLPTPSSIASKRPSRELLEELLFVRRLSVQQMASECNVSEQLIRNCLKEQKLPLPSTIFSRKQRGKRPSKELLEELLFTRRFSVQQMANECKVSEWLIKDCLRDYELPTPDSLNFKRPSKELLEEPLFTRRFSVQQMANECKVSEWLIKDCLRDYKLPLPSSLKHLKRPSKELLEDLLFTRRLSVQQMANECNVSERYIRDCLDDYKLPLPSTIIFPETLLAIVKDYFYFHSMKKVASLHQFCPNRIKLLLIGLGVDVSFEANRVKARIEFSWFPLLKVIKEILIGELLSDGNITFSSNKTAVTELLDDLEYFNALNQLHNLKNSKLTETNLSAKIQKFNESRRIITTPTLALFRTGRSLLAKPWLMYIQQVFQTHKCKCYLSDGVRIIQQTGKAVEYSDFNTWSTLQFAKEYFHWYADGKKIVPSDIVLTPRIILHWYIGDGNCSSAALEFSTHSFQEFEVEELADLLWRETGIMFRVRQKDKPGQFVIRNCSRVDAKKFFDYLESAPGASLAKKLFPWKFSRELNKKGVYDADKKFVDNDYFQTYMEVLTHFLGKTSLVFAKKIFPWKFNVLPKKDCV